MKNEGEGMKGAVVLLSGGQDSTTCLMLAIERYGKENVYPLSFNYEQKHKVEIQCAKRVCRRLLCRGPKILHVPALRELGGGALTNDQIRVDADATNSGNVYAEEHGLPPTVVPGRNVVFLALAAGYGARLGIYSLWTGGCLADYEGYPDCRPEFYETMQRALRFALDEPSLEITTPLTHISKGVTFLIAEQLGHLDLITKHTHTCYRGDRSQKFAWGYGCGQCPACKVRAAGWDEYFASKMKASV